MPGSYYYSRCYMKLQRQALSSHEVQTLCVNREVADKDSGRLYSKQVLCRIVKRRTLALPVLLYQVLMEIMAFTFNRGYIGPMPASAICNQYNRCFSLLHLSTCNNKAWGGTRCTGRICGTVYNNIYRDCMLLYCMIFVLLILTCMIYYWPFVFEGTVSAHQLQWFIIPQ